MSAEKRISLFDMPVGKTGVIVEIDGGIGMLDRLDALGIRMGSKVQKVTGQWLRGPVMIRIKDMRLALGFGMARKIWVEMEK